MESWWFTLSLLLCAYNVTRVCGDHFLVMEPATCGDALSNCFMDYDGVLAYRPHLDQYERDIGCDTSHLAIWLWAGEPFKCEFQNKTGTDMSFSDDNVSLSAVEKIGEEKHIYICVTNGTMGSGQELCNSNEIRNGMKEKEMDYFLMIIGSCLGGVFIVTTIILFGLYKRRTWENPTSWKPSSGIAGGSKTSHLDYDYPYWNGIDTHQYTLPRTRHPKITLVRSVLRKPLGTFAGHSDGNLHLSPRQYTNTCHRALSSRPSVSAPELHLYEEIEPCLRVNCRYQSDKCRPDISDPDKNFKSGHDCVELQTKSVSESNPDKHLYAEICTCTPGTQSYICSGHEQSLQGKYTNSDHSSEKLFTKSGNPDIHLYAELCTCTPGTQSYICSGQEKSFQDQFTNNIHDHIELRTIPSTASAPDLHTLAGLCGCYSGLFCKCSTTRTKYRKECKKSNIFDGGSDIEFHILSKSESSPDLNVDTTVLP
ncbi:uncharacterized protein [Argopecten irradians]|uniref:uncharacterized protein isoform X1 n=1 Tax=Argopecten irradians TaxID=31199 RepID=UPI00371F3CB9